MNTKNLLKFSMGMFALGQVLKGTSKIENDEILFEEHEYTRPFKLPQLSHPYFGNMFIYHKGENKNTSRAEKIANRICNEINNMTEIDLIPIYAKDGASTIKIKLKPMNNVKKSFKLEREIKYLVQTEEARIYPEGDKIVIEIPSKGQIVRFGDFMHDTKYRKEFGKTIIPIGKDIDGNNIYGDLAKMPHMLVAGATGSGKSVFINDIISALLTRNTPYDMKMILIDPKMVEFKTYEKLNYVKYITNTNKAISVLQSLCNEMDKRYAKMASRGCRDIETYNRKYPQYRMQKIVLVIDEMADMMIDKKYGKQVERNIVRLAQKARACGIHMILATQRPSREVVTGLIKANIPCRVCLSVMSRTDSMIVLDQIGAEKLQGHGDMLYLDGLNNKEAKRLQAGLITDDEIKQLVISLSLDNQPESLDEINWNEMSEPLREYYGRK